MIGVRVFGIILASAVAVTAPAATTALAQVKQEQPRSALAGHNTTAPVDVTSDRFEVQDRADRAVFSGNVHAVQANMSLDTDRLTLA